ncbi:MAG TPA: hypothetical protein VE775_00215 [Pyrinomonadaceae bacterium]|jgi:hypothetical protein|nr:hypothetical protein [Pyrinomonadaceae bacterium]
MSSCQQCQTEIETAARPDALTARATEHLSACAACRALQTERRGLRQLIGELEPVGAPPDFDVRLRARIAAQQRASAPFSLWLFTPRAVGLAAAASLVLVFGVALGWRARQPASMGDATPPLAQVSSPAAQRPQVEPTQISPAGAASAVVENNSAGGALAFRSDKRAASVGRHESAGLNARRPARLLPDVRDASLAGVSAITAHGVENQMASLTPIAVPVPASAQPLKVLMRDTQGAARVVSIEPVSFGSRDLLGARAQTTPAKATNEQGVW